MKFVELTKRIEDLSERLSVPTSPSDGIRIDFSSFTQPEQLVLLKNFELDDRYRGKWTREAVLENMDLIIKGNHIVIDRTIELFLKLMPGALMLDELECWFLRYHFYEFLRNLTDCYSNLKKWSEKDRQDFLRDIKPTPDA